MNTAEKLLANSTVVAPSLTRLLALKAEAAALIGRYDHVTRLPNRLQFIDDFPALAAPTRGPRLLIMVTLAEAKHYNEILRALGHAFAEAFVRAGATALAAHLPPDAEMYHVSVLSLAFAIDHANADAVPGLVKSVAGAFSGALLVNDIPIKTKVGVGLLSLEPDADPAEVLRAALAAAQDSRRGEEGWAWYNHRSDAAHIRAFRILADLPGAIGASDQLSLHFQPRIDLQSGHCIGAEALIRWRHPELGSVSPVDLIPLAEQTALIGPLTDWVLETALRQASQLLKAGRRLRISVNASPINLSEPGFDEKLLRLCAEHSVGPDLMEVEFTEGTLAGNLDRATAQLNRIRSAGVEVAIDDFGSGFANLNYLTTIPADVLKIDQSFIRPLGSATGSEFLVRQIVDIARGLNFRVCAEGIETAATYDFLRGLGCDEGQGYFMARPMPAAELGAWLAARD